MLPKIKKFKNYDTLSFLITAIFFLFIIYISFFHHLSFTEGDGIFYYNSGKEILFGNSETINLPGASVAGPILHAFLGNLLNDAFTAGKLLSLFGGTGIVFLSYFITKNLFDKKVALLTQLFFVVNAKLVFLSIMVLNEIMPLFFIFLSLYFATKKQKNIFDFLLIGIFLGISFSFRFQSVIVLFSFLIFLVFFERRKILKIKQSFLTLFSFVIIIIPILLYNFFTYGKFSSETSNMYILVLFKFQTEQWHREIENIIHDGLVSSFLIDPNLFLKNYFYNLFFHNPDHLFKFSIDTFDTLSIIPLIPIIGMIPVFGGFLYITKISITKLQFLLLVSTFSLFFFLILFFGDFEYHFMLLVLIPFVFLGLNNLEKIPNNIKFLLLFTIIFMGIISIIPVYKAYQLFPIWLLFPALSSLFFIEGIPTIQSKIKQLIKQLIQYKDVKNET